MPRQKPTFTPDDLPWPWPLGPLLTSAREKKRWTKGQTARDAQVTPYVISQLEQGYVLIYEQEDDGEKVAVGVYPRVSEAAIRRVAETLDVDPDRAWKLFTANKPPAEEAKPEGRDWPWPLGDVLRTARDKKGWTQAKTANACGVTPYYYGDLERGYTANRVGQQGRIEKPHASPDFLFTVARALDLDPVQVFTLAGKDPAEVERLIAEENHPPVRSGQKLDPAARDIGLKVQMLDQERQDRALQFIDGLLAEQEAETNQ